MVKEFLKHNGLGEEDLSGFLSGLVPTQVKKGAVFLSFGQVSRYLALVERGYLRTYHLNEAGLEVTIDFARPVGFCGSYYSFYQQSASFECVEAITDCELQLVSFDMLQKLYSKSFSMNVFGRKVLEKACLERDLRLKKVMYLSAKEKYQWFLDNYPDLYRVTKLTHIASFLGMKLETLSRVRRKFVS